MAPLEKTQRKASSGAICIVDGQEQHPHTGTQVLLRRHGSELVHDDTGATTAEYAITTLAACGFAALLVVVLKSDTIRELITGVITNALGLGG